jgi:hypothetical protein
MATSKSSSSKTSSKPSTAKYSGTAKPSTGTGGTYYSPVKGWRPTNNPTATVIYTDKSGKPTGQGSPGAGATLSTTVPTKGGGTQTVDWLGNVTEKDSQGNVVASGTGKAKPEEVAGYLKGTASIIESNRVAKNTYAQQTAQQAAAAEQAKLNAIRSNTAAVQNNQQQAAAQQQQGLTVNYTPTAPPHNTSSVPDYAKQNFNIAAAAPKNTYSGATMTAAKPNEPGTKNIISIEEYNKEQRLKNDNPINYGVDYLGFKLQEGATWVGKNTGNNPLVSELGVPVVLGAVSTAQQIVGHPYQTVKGVGTFVLNPVQGVQKLQEGYGAMTAEKGEAYTLSFFAGQQLGGYGVSKVVGAAAKASPVKFEFESTTVPTKGGGSVKVSEVGVKAGPYGYPLFTKTTVNPAVQNLGTGEFLTGAAKANAPMSTPYTQYGIGKPNLAQKITPAELGGSVAQPVTASGGKAVQGVIDLTAAETTRLQSNVNVAYLLGKEKGLPVKEFVVNIERVKNPKASSKIIEAYSGEEGTLFGSLTTKQLPNKPSTLSYLNYVDDTGKPVTLKSFQNLKQGDVDLIFPTKTVEQIRGDLPGVVQKFNKAGESVEVSPGTNIIQFKGTTNKFIEVKSGINQETLGLGDEAPAGYLGIKFPDFKKGQAPSNVPFGETYAIRAGEQLQRKGAGASIFSPGDAGETPAFSQPGVLGKQGNPRGLKDTAGFVQQSAGIIEIRSSSLNPLKRASAEVAKGELNKFLSSYTPAQQADIIAKVKGTTGSIELTKAVDTNIVPNFGAGKALQAAEGEALAASAAERSPYLFKVTREEPSLFSTKPSSTSPSTSSPVSSPSLFSTKPSSTSPSTSSPVSSPSIFSTSPAGSPGSKTVIDFSPSPSATSPVKSPSLVLSPTSPYTGSLISPSPIKSPRSPSRGGGSPSPFIPSPTPPSPTPPSPSPKPPSPSPKPSSPGGSSFNSPYDTPKGGGFFSPVTRGSKNKAGGYEVLVKSKGIFKRVATTKTVESAFLAGKTKIQNTASASFKVKPINSTENIGAAGRRLLPTNTFYESKKSPGTFIQRRANRIGTAGEKREITYKGIFSQKSKKSSKILMGGFRI